MNDQQHINELTLEQRTGAGGVECVSEALESIRLNTPEMPFYKDIEARLIRVAELAQEMYGASTPLAVAAAKIDFDKVLGNAAVVIKTLFNCSDEVALCVATNECKRLNEEKHARPSGIMDPRTIMTPVYDGRFGINPKAIVNKFEYWYLNLLIELLGAPGKGDRTGTGTRSITHVEYKHDLREYFPSVRSRWFKPENPVKELEWMISGSNNEKDLAALGVPFWASFADETGNLGPVYGYLWRHWPNGDGTETDQLDNLRYLLAHDPDSRRMLINCWHPTFIPDSKVAPKENYKFGKQALTPCHYAINVLTQPIGFAERLEWTKRNLPGKFVSLYPVCGKEWCEQTEQQMDLWNVPKRYLDLKFIMRSSDTVLGLPANFSFYGHMALALATEANMVPRYLCYSGMDVHMYVNHMQDVRKQLEWAKQNPYETFGQVTQVTHEAPVGTPITELDHKQFTVTNYEKEQIGPFIRFPIAV